MPVRSSASRARRGWRQQLPDRRLRSRRRAALYGPIAHCAKTGRGVGRPAGAPSAGGARSPGRSPRTMRSASFASSCSAMPTGTGAGQSFDAARDRPREGAAARCSTPSIRTWHPSWTAAANCSSTTAGQTRRRSAGNTIAYHQHVGRASGSRCARPPGVRLFMVPGMGHCDGGEGTGHVSTRWRRSSAGSRADVAPPHRCRVSCQ